MSHIQRLKEIRVNLLGRGLTHLESMVDSLIADMEAERTSIDKAMDKLEDIHKPNPKYNDINGKVLNSKMFGVE
jgi:cell division ATPase FtsA